VKGTVRGESVKTGAAPVLDVVLADAGYWHQV
jgi:hypothetical protein